MEICALFVYELKYLVDVVADLFIFGLIYRKGVILRFECKFRSFDVTRAKRRVNTQKRGGG